MSAHIHDSELSKTCFFLPSWHIVCLLLFF